MPASYKCCKFAARNVQLNCLETGRQDSDLKLNPPKQGDCLKTRETMQRHFPLMLWFPEEMTAGTNQYLHGKHCCYFFSHGPGLRSRRKLQVSICEEWNLNLGDVTFKKQGALAG